MRIYPPQLVREEEQVKITALVEYAGGTENLWYAVDRHYGDFLTIAKLDAFVVGLLPFAMQQNEDIYVNGALSEKLFYNLTHAFIKILTLLIPSLHPIKIIPEDLDDGKRHSTIGGVATGFSGGIDSFCTLIDHLNNSAVPQSYQLTHLVLNNVGSHGAGGRNLFQKRYQRLLAFAQEVQLPLIKIDSNLHDI
ncbi:MAG: hypothetical protein NW214_05415, partial [Pseudanabaenaceae cyanobacterium bins.39]|nr:hypothetical protein [Pseudanabaenaceae cyanobacterium bins.39]